MKEFLDSLGINLETHLAEDGCLVADIKDSNEFGKIYSTLDKSGLVSLDDDSSVITYDSELVQFDSDDYLLTMIGDFNANTYRLTIKER